MTFAGLRSSKPKLSENDYWHGNLVRIIEGANRVRHIVGDG